MCATQGKLGILRRFEIERVSHRDGPQCLQTPSRMCPTACWFKIVADGPVLHVERQCGANQGNKLSAESLRVSQTDFSTCSRRRESRVQFQNLGNLSRSKVMEQ